MSKIRKIIDDVRQNNGTEVDLVDKGIVHLTEAPGLCEYKPKRPYSGPWTIWEIMASSDWV